MSTGKIIIGLLVAGGLTVGTIAVIQSQKKKNLVSNIMTYGQDNPAFPLTRSELEKMSIGTLETILYELGANL